MQKIKNYKPNTGNNRNHKNKTIYAIMATSFLVKSE
jgi:hypothetical protein